MAPKVTEEGFRNVELVADTFGREFTVARFKFTEFERVEGLSSVWWRCEEFVDPLFVEIRVTEGRTPQECTVAFYGGAHGVGALSWTCVVHARRREAEACLKRLPEEVSIRMGAVMSLADALKRIQAARRVPEHVGSSGGRNVHLPPKEDGGGDR